MVEETPAESERKGETPTVQLVSDTMRVEGETITAAVVSTENAASPYEETESWSTVLQSPSNLVSFSPSKEIIGDGNLHGLGLLLATERSDAVGRFGDRTASYLSEIATAYDTFGKNLLKLSHSIHPDVWKGSDLDDECGDSENKGDSLSGPTLAQSSFDSVLDCGIAYCHLAECYRTLVVAPLKTTISASRIVLDTHGQRYAAARAQCFTTRRRALVARTMFVRAMHAAENSFRKWKKARSSSAAQTSGGDESYKGNPLTAEAPGWERAILDYGKAIPLETDILVKRLHEVEKAQSRYEELVENENDAVAYAQKMETEALDAVQEVELARVKLFHESVVKNFRVADVAELSKRFSTAKRSDTSPEASALDRKKTKDLLANIFARQSIVSYEEGVGRTDAETLGFPPTIGLLRDGAQQQVAGIAARIKAAQIWAEFLESFGTALLTLESDLKVDSFPKNTRQEPLGAMAFNAIGPEAAEMWKGVVKVFEDEAVVAGEFASTLANLRLQKLEVFLETAQKDLKIEKDNDDSNWKTLCEIARSESKAASRYRQAKVQHEKARERALNADLAKGDGHAEEEMGPIATKNRMSKALFAGGEVMKKIQDNARIVMAKNSLLEAEQNAAKEQQILDEATALKSQASIDYNRVTETRVQKLVATNKQIKKEFENIMEVIALGIGRLQKARANGLDRPLDGAIVTYDLLIKDVDEWLQSVKYRMEANRKIAVIDEGDDNDRENGEGFQLSVRLCHSEPLEDLLRLTCSTIPPPDFISKIDDSFGADSSEDELDIQGDNLSFEGIGSDGSVGPATPTANGDAQYRESESISIPNNVPNEKKAEIKRSDSNFEGATTTTNRQHKFHDMEVFMQQFGNYDEVNRTAPDILQIISCAYRPKEKAGFLIPALHGRLYTTPEKIYFLAMDGKNFVLAWRDVKSVTIEKGFMGQGDSAIQVTYKTAEGEASFVLSRLVPKDGVLSHLQKLLVDSQAPSAPLAEDDDGQSLRPVPPDSLLRTMEVVLSKHLRGVTIKEVYEKAWSEGNYTSEKPFYEPWLEDEECFGINVGEWEFAEAGSEGFLGPWCKERYSQRRLTTFKFKRSTHLYIGPPVAVVKQMHYCRVEGNDKCIVAISATFEGIPYSDVFTVEMRWVAHRHGLNDLDINVGLEVDFIKSTMLKSQIRSATISESKNVHVRMFDAIKRVCQASDSPEINVEESISINDDGNEEVEEPTGLLARIRTSFTGIPVNPNFLLFTATMLAYPFLFNFFSSLLGSPTLSMNEAHRLNTELQELRAEVRELRVSLDMAIEILKKRV